MELDLLALLKPKAMYDRFHDKVSEHMLSFEGYQVFSYIGEYYKKKPEIEDESWDNIAAYFFFAGHGKGLTGASRRVYVTLFNKLKTHTVSESDIDFLMKELITRDYINKIHNSSLTMISTNESDIDELYNLVNSCKTELESYSTEELAGLVTDNIHTLISATMTGPGFNWRINNLNECVGPLRKGNFVVVGARPDSGKTTFLISEVSNFASQIKDDECILWINNEEAGEKVQRRLVQSGIGWTDRELMADPSGGLEKFKSVVGPLSKIKHVKRALFTVKDVEKLIKKFNPRMIIFDQLWKIIGFEKETGSEVGRQTLLFAWARSLGSEYGPVITVHQLGGEAEGERYPTMKLLYGSQTGIQGEADLIIMIGRSRDPAENDYRFFSLPKNKLGDGLTIPNRNARFFLKIKHDIGRYEEVGEYVTK